MEIVKSYRSRFSLRRKEGTGDTRTNKPSRNALKHKSPLTHSSTSPCSVLAISNNPKLRSRATIIEPSLAALRTGRYFPFPAPESRPREYGGTFSRNRDITGHGWRRGGQWSTGRGGTRTRTDLVSRCGKVGRDAFVHGVDCSLFPLGRGFYLFWRELGGRDGDGHWWDGW